MKKILVIDDDADILEAVQLTLMSHGYDADTITKSDETYLKVDSFKPDLIILDVLLSGNDGRMICKKLKASRKTKHIPIIMISAHPTAKVSSIESGANSFVAKPFSVKEIIAEVQKYVG